MSGALDALVTGGLGVRYTAAVARVERGGRAVFERAYGMLDGDANARPTLATTPFDLASLTKVFVATATLRAVADGALALDAPASAYVPTWRATAHATITPRMLLAHTAGMASGADYRTLFASDVAAFALARDLVARPGERVVYSDLGFIALGVVLARACGRALPGAMRPLLDALGTEGTAFRPRNDDPRSVAATEDDPWRGRVRGVVHDEKAFLMGGVAGHAGLFGTAHDVARVADAYLAATAGRAQTIVAPDLARAAIEEHGADSVLRRGLGWALKTTDDNSAGAALSRRTFGHTGFTGTSVWADPQRDLSVVLLTNAVYFGRRDLRDVRAAVCDAAARAFA